MSLDLSPLFRSTIGFDRMSQLLESAFNDVAQPAYPPYNIEKVGENDYRLVLAVAGFGEKDLTLTVKEQTLIVEGKQQDRAEGHKYLHRGIAGRAFERRFELADHMVVEGARLENGLLTIEIKREVPESMKPRQIPIANGKGKPIEHKLAA